MGRRGAGGGGWGTAEREEGVGVGAGVDVARSILHNVRRHYELSHLDAKTRNPEEVRTSSKHFFVSQGHRAHDTRHTTHTEAPADGEQHTSAVSLLLSRLPIVIVAAIAHTTTAGPIVDHTMRNLEGDALLLLRAPSGPRRGSHHAAGCPCAWERRGRGPFVHLPHSCFLLLAIGSTHTHSLSGQRGRSIHTRASQHAVMRIALHGGASHRPHAQPMLS